MVDAEAVEKQWGIRPDQVVDFQALWGDSTDNIPGIPGVGQKTAAQLLAQYETLEGVFEHVDEISGTKRRENIRARRGRGAAESPVGASVDATCRCESTGSRLTWAGWTARPCWSCVPSSDFTGCAKRLTGLSVAAAPRHVAGAVRDGRHARAALQQLVATLRQQTAHRGRHGDDVDARAVGGHRRATRSPGSQGTPCIVPVRAPAGDPRLDAAAALDALRPVLENEQIEKVGQNLKYDMIVLRGAGVSLRGVAFDTMVADYLLAPGERNHSMDDLAKRYLNHETIKISELIGTGKKQKRMDQVPVALVTPYAGRGCRRAAAAGRHPGRAAARGGVGRAVLHAGNAADRSAGRNGVQRHPGRCAAAAAVERAVWPADGRVGERRSTNWPAAHSTSIRPSSWPRFCSSELGLPVVKKTKTGPSTDASVLSQLAPQHPLPAKIIEYRQQAKLKSTYVDALPAAGPSRRPGACTPRSSRTWRPRADSVRPIRICRTFRSARATAARSARPSFRASQAGSCCAPTIRRSNCACWLISRGTRRCCAAFAEDRDIHAQVASEVYGVPLEDVTAEMRRAAKAINFGVIYGQSPFGLAKSLSIEKSEAAAFIDAYFATLSGGRQVYGRRYWQNAAKTGMLVLPWDAVGRSRELATLRFATDHVNGTCRNASPSTRSFRDRRRT